MVLVPMKSEPLKWSHGRYWRLSFRVLCAVAAAAAAVICVTKCFRVRARGMVHCWQKLEPIVCTAVKSWQHAVMGLSRNMLDLFFGRRIFWPLRMRETSFISTPAFSIASFEDSK